MHWMILVENEEKAAAFRKALPIQTYNAVTISTDGMPWDRIWTLPSDDKNVLLTHILKPSYVRKTRIIQDTANSIDRILLAFDVSTTGEAIAWEFESHFDKTKPCARWGSPTLDPQDIVLMLTEFETMQAEYLPKTHRGMAESYWTQLTIDKIWQEQLGQWLSRNTARTERPHRMMAALLKIIHKQQRKTDIYIPQDYWEMRCRLKDPDKAEATPATPTTQLIAMMVVPTPMQLGNSHSPRTGEIWRKKILEANAAAIAGPSGVTPESGQSWRFDAMDDIATYQNHLKKFPFFTVDTVIKVPPPLRRGPLTFQALIDLAETTGKCTADEAERALLHLYHCGWISQPYTCNLNLSHQTLEQMLDYASRTGAVIESSLHNFGESPERARYQEAIRPTRWDRTPDKTQDLMPNSPINDIRIWVYRMIHQRAWESQLPLTNPEKARCFLVGPVLAKPKIGETPRENRLTAHMNLVLALDWEGTPPPKGKPFQCFKTEGVPRKTEEPKTLSETQLLSQMTANGLGKRPTLVKMMALLREQKLITPGPELKLTATGVSLYHVLISHFGGFLDQDYHRVIAHTIQAIENNETAASDFIENWWDTIRIHFQTDLTTPPSSIP